MNRDKEIREVTAELDGLLDQLAESVEEMNAILKRPKQQPPDNNVKVVSSE